MKKFNASKVSAIAVGTLIAGSGSLMANDAAMFDYNDLGTAPELRSEILSMNSSNFTNDFVLAEMNCGENTCGSAEKGEEQKCGEKGEKGEEHKCGEGKCGEKGEKKEEKSEKGEEHKCGEGKCGL